MSYQHTRLPETGDKIRVAGDRLAVTDQPILGFVEGDGIGPDITRACLRIWDAAVERAYGGRRKVALGGALHGGEGGRALRR